jgi:dipeptidyl aminopeptidase/acylaminoacyl peptidase
MQRITPAMVASGRVVGEPRLSPDGTTVAFVATTGGRAQLVTVPAGGGAEVVLSTEPAPCPARADGGGVFDWLPDGNALVYAAVDGGIWLQPAAGGPPRLLATPHAAGPAAAPAASPDGTRVAYVVDQHHVAVASIDPHGPWPVRLTTTADFAFDPTWSADGTLVAWHEWDVPDMPWDASRIVVRRADGTGDVDVVAGGAGVAVAQPRFGPDGRLGFLSDAESGWSNLWVADPDGTGAKVLLAEPTEHGGPSWGQGARTWAWSPDGAHVAWRTNDDGYSRLLVASTADPEWKWVLGVGVHHALTWRGHRLVAVRTGARTPTQIVAYEVAAALATVPARRQEALDRARATVAQAAAERPELEGRLEEAAAAAARQLGAAGQVGLKAQRSMVARGPVAGWEAMDLPEPEVVRWAGGDGQQVVGRLLRPEGVEHPPLLCWIHGGPTDQWLVTFNPRHAYFLSRGWAVLVPDHRGSTGHGRAYAQALAGRWGELDVADCAAGMQQMADRGLVDGERMAPIGSSAGGFTALLLLARHPELCAAGVALSAVADLVDLAARSHRFEAHYTHSLIGPLPDAYDLHVARSPLTHAANITAPLLLLHGDADPVVPVDQARALHAELQRFGRRSELHVFEGEGHGWGRPEVVVDELARVEAFLGRHVLHKV